MEKIMQLMRLSMALVLPMIISSALFAQQAPRVICYDIAPFIIPDNGKATGMAADLITQILTKAGMEPTIVLIPLTRGLQALNEGNTIFGFLGRTPDREPKYTWIIEIYPDAYSFSTLAPAKAINSYEEAAVLEKILVVRNSAPDNLLRKKNFTNLDNSAESESYNFEKIKLGRANGWFGAASIQKYFKKQEPNLVLGKPVQPVSFWMFATKDVSPDIIKKLQKASNEVKKSGAFDKAFESLK
jgi:polar amino acid transport system substrate-binding protein